MEKEITCLRCGHPPCRSCQNWCDEVIRDEDGSISLCCDGVCEYASSEINNKDIKDSV